MKFSVLMSIYFKESPDYFNEAMKSIWAEQSIKPSQIVLVQDGPLSQELYSMISVWEGMLGNALKCVPLENNVGLGEALNIGFQYCDYEIIARMDTDDIAMPDRFEKQLAALENLKVDICSSWITEFDQDENTVTALRRLPEGHDDIFKFAKVRCPINHPAVMYRKSMVIKAGGYKSIMWFEDYYLWVRMLIVGAKFYNIQEPLVHMRAGMCQIERRSGIAYAKSELRLLKKFHDLGFLNAAEYFLMITFKFSIRVMPKGIVRQVYKLLRSKI